MTLPDPEPMVPTGPRRRFTILDGVVFIVILALAFALTRSFLKQSAWQLRPSFMPNLSQRVAAWIIHVSTRFMSMAMLGLLIMRLRRPRPPLRRLSRQPGAVACTAAVVAMAASGSVILSLSLFRTVHISSLDQHTWLLFLGPISPAVTYAWILLWLSGRWQSEPSWIDRLGRLFGAYWIALGLYFSMIPLGLQWFPHIPF